jgi:hypothetical protein
VLRDPVRKYLAISQRSVGVELEVVAIVFHSRLSHRNSLAVNHD